MLTSCARLLVFPNGDGRGSGARERYACLSWVDMGAGLAPGSRNRARYRFFSMSSKNPITALLRGESAYLAGVMPEQVGALSLTGASGDKAISDAVSSASAREAIASLGASGRLATGRVTLSANMATKPCPAWLWAVKVSQLAAACRRAGLEPVAPAKAPKASKASKAAPKRAETPAAPVS